MMLYTVIGLLSPICLANQELYDAFFFLHLFSNSALCIHWDQFCPTENMWNFMADFSRIRISPQRYLLWTKSVAGAIMAQFTSEELCCFIWASVRGKVVGFFAMADDVLNSTSVLYLGLFRCWWKDWAFFNFCTWKYYFMYTYVSVYQTIVYAIEKWMHRKEIMQWQGRHIFALLLRKNSDWIHLNDKKWKLKVLFGLITRQTTIKLTLVYSQSTLSEHQHCNNTVCIIQSRLLFYGARTKAYFRHKRGDLFWCLSS